MNKFEQHALKRSHHKRKYTTGTQLTSTYTPNTSITKSDKHLILSFVGLVLFIVMLILV